MSADLREAPNSALAADHRHETPHITVSFEWCQTRGRNKIVALYSGNEKRWEIRFQTKPEIALEQIRQAVADKVTRAPVLADAGYEIDRKLRAVIIALGLPYVVGGQSSTTVWAPGKAPLLAKPWRRKGRPPRLLRRSQHHEPLFARELALSLRSTAWKTITWRAGTKQPLRSRFAALRVRPAHWDHERAEPYPEEWLLMEWPQGESEPTKYWLSTLPASTSVRELVRMAKPRWIIERDYEELIQELG